LREVEIDVGVFWFTPTRAETAPYG
jgi:hypothetical protein